MSTRSRAIAVLLTLFASSCVSPPQPGDQTDGRVEAKGGNSAKKPAAPIAYHGGPVIHGTFDVYYVWYGNWSSNTAGTILTELASNIGGSPYYNINTTYTDEIGPVENKVAFGGAINDPTYSHGKNLTDDDVFAIVSNAIETKQLPNDEHGIYFVLTTPDVQEVTGFCSNYCGWHQHRWLGATDIKYSFVGDPEQQCPSLCEPQQSVSPNDNPGADAMAMMVARELAATSTDPDQNAWFDATQRENADLCVGNYGVTFTTASGAQANVHLGSRDYLLQSIWINQGAGMCGVNFP